MSNKTVRWGILGCADIVERRILPAMEEVENGVLHAIATRGPSERLERVTAAYQPPHVYHSYEELLADPDVDAIYIPLPNRLHAQWTIQAAQAGKHVLCEKPIACRTADLKKIEAAARENKVHVMEAFACLHSPLYATIRKLIADGVIGKLVTVDSVFGGGSAKSKPSISVNADLWGGSIHDVGCYNIMNIRQLTGREPVSVQAMATFFPEGADASVTALMDMGDGVLATYKSSKLGLSHRGMTITGDKGFIRFPKTPNSWGHQEIEVITGEGAQMVSLDIDNPYAGEITQLGRCILEGQSPVVSLEESGKNLRVMELLHTAVGSWMTGEYQSE